MPFIFKRLFKSCDWRVWLIIFALQVFIKSELKVGVIYVKENQYTEEEILANNEHSSQFDDFITILGEKVRLKG